MDEPTYTCAVWYLDDHGQINYDVFTDEASAANSAIGYDGDGSVLGLQWADGRTVTRKDWAAFAEGKRREAERWEERRNNPPTPTRDNWAWMAGSESESEWHVRALAQPYAGRPGWRAEWELDAS